MQIIRDQRDNLVLAALLHDIGKLVQRAKRNSGDNPFISGKTSPN